MAKRNKGTTPANPQQVVINDLGIQIRTIDRSPKDLAKFKQAIQSAENIQMPLRTQLYNLFEDIMLDEHLTSVVDQRRNSRFDTSLIFQKDGEAIEDVQRIVDTIAFERLCKLIIDSKLYGYSLVMCDFTPETGPVIELVPRPHVVPEFGVVVANPGDATGISYCQPPYTNLYIGVGEPKDLGLLVKAIPLVLMKRGNVQDWAKFNEVFGQPFRKATYNPQDPASKAQLEAAMANMGNMAYAVVPDGANVEILGNYQSASADTYGKFTDVQNKALSKLIVGQTMTTESGSSLSQSEVHERVADRVAYADRRFLLKVLESMVKPLMIAQGVKGAADGNFQFVTEEADVSKKDRLTGDIEIHTKVGKLSKEYWSNEYNVQFVDDSDEEEVAPEEQPETDPKEDDPAPDEKPEKEKPEPGEKPKQKNAAADGWDWKRALLELKSFFQSSPDPVISQFGAELETLYFAHGHVDVLTLADTQLPKFLNIKKLVGKALDNIFKGFSGLVEPNLFRITYTALSSAIDEGWASIEYGKQNPAFASQLKKSGAWFAARKSYRQREELAAQLMDGDGKTRTWKQFQAATKTIAGDYNEVWLKVEFDTAIASARNAGRWKEFEADADLYPNLEYLPSRAATPRDEHKPFYGVIRPIDDDFWVHHFPPTAFNCQCGVEQSDGDVTAVPEKGPKPAPGLDHNPGKTGEVFSKSHPYSKAIDDDTLKQIDGEGEKLANDIDDEQ